MSRHDYAKNRDKDSDKSFHKKLIYSDSVVRKLTLWHHCRIDVRFQRVNKNMVLLLPSVNDALEISTL
nr:MAG TPA: hypothetical protein [Caudoviricetes sp.]